MALNVKQRKADKMREELRKLAQDGDNKMCAICGMRGPLYVVLDFQIFVCSTCSAVHRSLQHKVKGVSMSDFNDDELAGLRVGGNARAARIWKEGYRGHVAQQDEHSVRECIRSCFVERRYCNVAELQKLHEDVATAALPPLKVLTSLDAIGPLQSTAPPPANPANPPAPSSSNLDSTDFFSQMQAASTAAPVAKATAAPTGVAATSGNKGQSDPFDDFFGTAASVAPQGQSTPAASVSVHDLFQPVPSSHGSTEAAKTSSNNRAAAQDFFTTPPPEPSAHSHRGATDFFQQTAWSPAHVAASTPQPQVRQQNANPPQTHHNSVDAFASLDPFGGRPR